jgi:hypothetical protein
VADQHHQAVLNTLSWADEAAAAGDYADALAWLDVITAIGDGLPSPYPARRASWQAAMRTVGPPGETRRAEQGRTNQWTDFKTAHAAA